MEHFRLGTPGDWCFTLAGGYLLWGEDTKDHAPVVHAGQGDYLDEWLHCVLLSLNWVVTITNNAVIVMVYSPISTSFSGSSFHNAEYPQGENCCGNIKEGYTRHWQLAGSEAQHENSIHCLVVWLCICISQERATPSLWQSPGMRRSHGGPGGTDARRGVRCGGYFCIIKWGETNVLIRDQGHYMHTEWIEWALNDSELGFAIFLIQHNCLNVSNQPIVFCVLVLRTVCS